jgi:hypothetical protein
MSAETSQDEWYLNDLIDALSYEPTNEFSDAIKHFLLERKYGQRWTRPSGELLATHPDLFVTGWTRFFSERPYAEWRDSGYIQLFLFHPEQIIALKQYMSIKAKSTWEKFKQALEEMLTKSDFCLLEEARKKIKAILA